MGDQSNGQNRDAQRPYAFNPNDYVIQIKSKDGFRDYLPVQWRLVWFRTAFPQGTIETEILHLDIDRETEEEVEVWDSEKEQHEKITKHGKGFVIYKATVKDGKGGVATGTKMEKAASFGDWLEKAETGAIGRALAALGFGTQFAPELNEEHRIVDSPVARNDSSTSSSGRSYRPAVGSSTGRTNGNGSSAVAVQDPNAAITEQQLTSIHKLCDFLGKPEPDNVSSISFAAAKKLIQQLTAEYRELKQNSKAS
ncbi:MAG: hypothetical protein JOZ18_19550 [Chloroflexi bacterium]|nr:hypothetical protein [Chloroflexota bacterium]